MTQDTERKIVGITGAGSGLGQATARHAGGDDENAFEIDVTKFDQVKNLVDHAAKHHGRIDVIINNADPMPQQA
jgi:NAD(P)-dependent dehydrogenase (short-subunit alcohol dehydrogenase family)